jgi:hypothetical protein
MQPSMSFSPSRFSCRGCLSISNGPRHSNIRPWRCSASRYIFCTSQMKTCVVIGAVMGGGGGWVFVGLFELEQVEKRKREVREEDEQGFHGGNYLSKLESTRQTWAGQPRRTAFIPLEVLLLSGNYEIPSGRVEGGERNENDQRRCSTLSNHPHQFWILQKWKT